MPRKNSLKVIDKHHDEVESLIEELMNTKNYLGNIDPEQNPASVEARKVRGPTLLKDIWNMSPGRTINVQFNSRNQAIGKEGRKLSSFLGILARNPKLTPLNINDWRSFDGEQKNKLVELVRRKFSIPAYGEEFVKKSIGKKWKDYKCELRCTYTTKYKTKDALMKNRPNRIPSDQWIGLVSYWFSDKGKIRSQANRCNRTKQKMSHTGGSKSIGTLMFEKAKDGIEPTRAEVFILTHRKRKDGRALDEDSAKIVDMMQEKLNSGETSNTQPIGNVAWKGDVYSQVMGEERSGYVRCLGLGPTPSQLWGSKSSIGNILGSNTFNGIIQKLEQEVRELKKSKEKQDEEMHLMKHIQDKLASQLSSMTQVFYKHFPTELPLALNFGSSFEQVLGINNGYEQEYKVEKIATPYSNMFEASGSIKRENHLDEAFEKNAPVKKIIDLGTPSSGSPSTIDAYERMFSTIPKYARFGKLFKNVDPRTCEEKKNIDCVDDGIQPIETNQKSMTKDGDITSLLKLLRKNNDEDTRKLAAKTLFDRQMFEDYFIG